MSKGLQTHKKAPFSYCILSSRFQFSSTGIDMILIFFFFWLGPLHSKMFYHNVRGLHFCLKLYNLSKNFFTIM